MNIGVVLRTSCLVQSTQEFLRGIGKGVSSLVRGVVNGALSAGVGIGVNITRFLALLAAGMCNS